MAVERVQKIIARAGLASRRLAEEWIRDGQVTINGKVAKLGDQAQAGRDAIKVNGKLLQLNEPPVYLAFNKPKAIICTVAPDPHGRLSVGSYLTQIKSRVYPVGQMDFNSEGLMLLTNDGDFAERLQKSSEVPRVYHVKVKGHPDYAALQDLAKPMRLDGRSIVPHSVRMASEFTQKAMIEVILLGWTAVDLKGFFEKKGFLVERIIRVGIGQIELGELKPGKFKFLKKSQVEALLAQPELGLRGREPGAEPPPAPKKSAHGGPVLPRPLARPIEKPQKSSRSQRPGKPRIDSRTSFGGRRSKRDSGAPLPRPRASRS